MQSLTSMRTTASERLAALHLRERWDGVSRHAGDAAARIPDPATLPVLKRAPRLVTFLVALVLAVLVFWIVSALAGAIYGSTDVGAEPVFQI